MKKLAREYFDRAETDYQAAGVLLGQAGFSSQVCFLLQQCVEKLFKAAIVEHGGAPDKTHNLFTLDGALKGVFPSWQCDPADLHVFALAAVDYRYPGPAPTQTEAAATYAACQRLRGLLRQVTGT